MPVQKLKAFLDQEKVKYTTVKHSRAYTSQEIAASTHVAGKEFAKTVILIVNGKMAMAVLPASYEVDFDLIKEILGTPNVSLATEPEFKYRFSDCELGAMPPFGNLYDMDVFVAEALTEDKEIAFNAGSHTEIIRLDLVDYMRLVNPRIVKFSWKTVAFPHDPKEKWEED